MSAATKENSDHPKKEPGLEPMVRLIEPLSRPFSTPIERLAISTLKLGAVPLYLLVERVAADLYVEEIRNGAWVLDIGLFGSDLFVPDVAREIEAGNGTFWQIEGYSDLH
jgi:hypothetical protein